MISFSDFQKLDIRIGTIKSAEKDGVAQLHPVKPVKSGSTVR